MHPVAVATWKVPSSNVKLDAQWFSKGNGHNFNQSDLTVTQSIIMEWAMIFSWEIRLTR